MSDNGHVTRVTRINTDEFHATDEYLDGDYFLLPGGILEVMRMDEDGKREPWAIYAPGYWVRAEIVRLK